MPTTDDLLDAVKRRHNLASDYALAKLLGVPTSGISNYRKGRSSPDDSIALRIAVLLGTNPDAVIFAIHAERAERANRTDQAAFWREQAERCGGLYIM